ncbi:hypothetical protein ACP70R_004293 [Stipagrostis hirtigluma subsp. patula]
MATARDGSESSGKASASGSDCSTPFRLNVHAREFVPSSPAVCPAASPLTAAGYYSPFVQLSSGGGGAGGIGLGADWSFFAEPDPMFFMPDFGHAEIAGAAGSNGHPKGASPADIAHKIIKQVEYQFSDTNLVANDFLMKIMNKDPEGYVPMSVVSDDGKKVRRAQPFTDRHKEELQSRMVIAENLPEDSTRNSLEKIFGTIGSVKNIRICHPQEPGSARSSKSDSNALVSNKLHALIEYETIQQADRAVDRLNDERNWRKGLRVRPVLRRSPKSAIRLKRPEFDHPTASDEEHLPHSQASSDSTTTEHLPQHSQEEQHVGGKKPWGRGRGRPQPHAAAAVPQSMHAGAAAGHLEPLAVASTRHAPQGPRMPDGTRGFTMGRGRLSVAAALRNARGTPVPAAAAPAAVVI